jgi:hypothetical protein
VRLVLTSYGDPNAKQTSAWSTVAAQLSLQRRHMDPDDVFLFVMVPSI